MKLAPTEALLNEVREDRTLTLTRTRTRTRTLTLTPTLTLTLTGHGALGGCSRPAATCDGKAAQGTRPRGPAQELMSYLSAVHHPPLPPSRARPRHLLGGYSWGLTVRVGLQY